jgi:hypothetical protein
MAAEQAISTRASFPPRGWRWTAERSFHLGFGLAIAAAVFLGFARTFFLRPWFPEWAAAHSSPEPIFYVHGVAFASWIALVVAQPVLIAARRVDLHRRLGWAGAVLAGAMVVLGTSAAVHAAARPTGFFDVAAPPLQFLIVPLGGMVPFVAFVSLGVASRAQPQHHKRWMLLATIQVVGAAISRWPFDFVMKPLPIPGVMGMDLCVDLFLVPMLVWDAASQRRPHPVTLAGGAVIVASAPVFSYLSQTEGWLSFADWAVRLAG